MPTDAFTASIEVEAGSRRVLAVLRDVGSQPEWIPEIKEAEVLETDARGLPAVARFAASTAVGTDTYTLGYDHSGTGMSWHLVTGRLQTGQEGVYELESAGRGRTKVTYDLTIHHNLPLPGFIRRRVIKGLVTGTLDGLKARVEAA